MQILEFSTLYSFELLCNHIIMFNSLEKPNNKATEATDIKMITIEEMSALDPQSGDSDIASVVYLSVKQMNPPGFFTKTSLVDFLTKAGTEEDAINPAYIERVKRTVDNFISQGFITEDKNGCLIANFDIKKSTQGV